MIKCAEMRVECNTCGSWRQLERQQQEVLPKVFLTRCERLLLEVTRNHDRVLVSMSIVHAYLLAGLVVCANNVVPLSRSD